MVGFKWEIGILNSLGIAPFHTTMFYINAICLFFMQSAWSLWLLTTKSMHIMMQGTDSMIDFLAMLKVVFKVKVFLLLL
jgi:hypothetical protein